METKLTLRMDDSIIKKAKQMAKSRKTSFSAMVADYLKSLESRKSGAKMSPVLSEISGVLRNVRHKHEVPDYKKYLEEKYL